MFDNIDKRRNFQIDVQKLGTEEWYVWLDPEERMQYSEAVKNASTPQGLNNESVATIAKLIASCQRKAADSDNNQPSDHGRYRWSGR